MSDKSVEILVDLKCDWKDRPPVYRLYVNNELFSERTYIWKNKYLEELLSVKSIPGDYTVHWEVLDATCKLSVDNVRVLSGSASVEGLTVRIKNENT